MEASLAPVEDMVELVAPSLALAERVVADGLGCMARWLFIRDCDDIGRSELRKNCRKYKQTDKHQWSDKRQQWAKASVSM